MRNVVRTLVSSFEFLRVIALPFPYFISSDDQRLLDHAAKIRILVQINSQKKNSIEYLLERSRLEITRSECEERDHISISSLLKYTYDTVQYKV